MNLGSEETFANEFDELFSKEDRYNNKMYINSSTRNGLSSQVIERYVIGPYDFDRDESVGCILRCLLV